ncbi:secreted RxLR effector protein 161-like [Nicotiana sylvestris]|uniref:secreted RxLR effector protein 161-like n=1 Tax=Nicotiana sylvestris TaxID=4096 RepID=UPI00388C4282
MVRETIQFLVENGFTRGKIDNTLSLKKRGRNLLIDQIYVDDIIFGATTNSLCEKSAKLMGSEFEMSIMGELNVFLGLQVKQPDIVFSLGLHAKFQSNPEESHLKAAKRILRYSKGTQNLVLYYTSGDNFNLIGYAGTDYAGYLVDRKNTYGMDHFLELCFISWGTRKQNSVALSTAEEEYDATGS